MVKCAFAVKRELGMDDNNRHRQQPPVYPVSNQRFPQGQGQGQASNQGQQQSRGFAGSSSDRFRPAPLQNSSSAGRGIGGGAAGSGYGYYSEGSSSAFSGTVPANPMQQYQSDYTSDQQRQQQQQQQQPQSFGSYNPNIMYNVPPQTQPVYDAQQFQARQPAAMQMLSDVAAPYFPGEATNPTQAPASVLHHQQVPSASPAVYQQNPTDRSSLLQGYPNMGNMSGMPQNAPPHPPEIMDEQQADYAPGGLEEAYDRYHSALKVIFQNIRAGLLVDASQSLLQVSDWLLTNVGDLGVSTFI